jgi:hypothetical protein
VLGYATGRVRGARTGPAGPARAAPTVRAAGGGAP